LDNRDQCPPIHFSFPVCHQCSNTADQKMELPFASAWELPKHNKFDPGIGGIERHVRSIHHILALLITMTLLELPTYFQS
jgi:hypothetical protein